MYKVQQAFFLFFCMYVTKNYLLDITLVCRIYFFWVLAVCMKEREKNCKWLNNSWLIESGVVGIMKI